MYLKNFVWAKLKNFSIKALESKSVFFFLISTPKNVDFGDFCGFLSFLRITPLKIEISKKLSMFWISLALWLNANAKYLNFQQKWVLWLKIGFVDFSTKDWSLVKTVSEAHFIIKKSDTCKFEDNFYPNFLISPSFNWHFQSTARSIFQNYKHIMR